VLSNHVFQTREDMVAKATTPRGLLVLDACIQESIRFVEVPPEPSF
jgi:hypothetical protein